MNLLTHAIHHLDDICFVEECFNTFHILIYSLLNYLEHDRQNMIPHTKIDIPTTIMISPLTDHLGLLYINDEDGPKIDLLCNVNIIPRIITIRPTTINDLSMRLLRFMNYRSQLANVGPVTT